MLADREHNRNAVDAQPDWWEVGRGFETDYSESDTERLRVRIEAFLELMP
jgi:hypothetical protein